MNGLKKIRTICNFSSCDLANVLGVTRQMISAWENGTKNIPKQRLTELSAIFHLDDKYFKEISEAEAQELVDMPKKRCPLLEKEAYVYDDTPIDPDNFNLFFGFSDGKTSLDEDFHCSLTRKKVLLDRIDHIIQQTDSPFLVDKTAAINNGCYAFEMTAMLWEKHKNSEHFIKYWLFYELFNTWKAILLAHDLIDKNTLEYREERNSCGEDREWIEELADILKKHWDKEYAVAESKRIMSQEEFEAMRKITLKQFYEKAIP